MHKKQSEFLYMQKHSQKCFCIFVYINYKIDGVFFISLKENNQKIA